MKEKRSEADDGYPFVSCHFFPHEPSVTQVDVDQVQVL